MCYKCYIVTYVTKNCPSVFVTPGVSPVMMMKMMMILTLTCRYNCLVIADTVASLGGTPFFTDKLELDVVYTGSQKCFACPPGICPITFSPRAM